MPFSFKRGKKTFKCFATGKSKKKNPYKYRATNVPRAPREYAFRATNVPRAPRAYKFRATNVPRGLYSKRLVYKAGSTDVHRPDGWRAAGDLSAYPNLYSGRQSASRKRQGQDLYSNTRHLPRLENNSQRYRTFLTTQDEYEL